LKIVERIFFNRIDAVCNRVTQLQWMSSFKNDSRKTRFARKPWTFYEQIMFDPNSRSTFPDHRRKFSKVGSEPIRSQASVPYRNHSSLASMEISRLPWRISHDSLSSPPRSLKASFFAAPSSLGFIDRLRVIPLNDRFDAKL